ncbi:MAG: VWA domain-containing protein [Polyangiaceae bacterium]|nr:VWA domain-containing protein [Polyangiaceae bacterium]
MKTPRPTPAVARAFLLWLLGSVLAVVVSTACSGDDPLAPPPSAAGTGGSGGGPGTCVDADGDGFGQRCVSGEDCDDTDPGVTDACYRCLTPNEGCPCATEGQAVPCGEVASRSGDQVNCATGTRVCTTGVWGACSMEGLEAVDLKAQVGRRVGAVSTGAVACVNMPCDPLCHHFDSSTPPGTDGNTTINSSGDVTLVGASGGGPPPTCGSTPQAATRIPLGMVLMVDRSGSMNSPTSKWTAVRDGTNTFVGSSGLSGASAGLDFFPPLSGDQCLGTQYTNPNLTVPIALLPGVAPTIQGQMNTITRSGSTPMLPAVNGALDAVFQWQTAATPRKGILVLITDGLPTDCGNCGGKKGKSAKNIAACRVQEIAQVIENYYYSYGIETFVLGIDDSSGGAQLKHLNTLARAGSGGTRNAYILNGGTATDVTTALNAIRDQSLSCDFQVPAPPPGGVVDPMSATVILTSGGAPTTLPRVDSPGLCAGDGFFYDNTANTVTLCPTSCSTAKGDLSASIQIDYDCVDACAGGSARGDAGPVDMFFVFDRSGSMDTQQDGVTLWHAATTALKNFLASDDSQGMGFGLNFFPAPNGCDKCRTPSGCGFLGLQPCNAPYPVCGGKTGGTCPPTPAGPTYNYYSNENSNSCTVATYQTPSNTQGLALQTITTAGLGDPVVAAAFNRFKEVIPEGGTPTRPALEGSYNYLAGVSNPTGRRRVLVLVTDGLPTGCTSNLVSNVATVAQTAYNAGTSVFVIGVGAQSCVTSADCPSGQTCDMSRGVCQGGTALANLDQVALAGSGNKQKAFLVALGNPVGFLDALNTIRHLATPCNLSIPTPPLGGTLDLAGSQILVTSRCPTSGACSSLAATASATALTQVANAGECSNLSLCPTGNCFYYDNPTTPSQMIMCSHACDMVQGDPLSRADIIFQCVNTYTAGAATFEYDASGMCPAGYYPVWGNWSWTSTTPTTSKISFEVFTGKRDDSTGVVTDLVGPVSLWFTRAGLNSATFPPKGKQACASLASVCDPAVATDTQSAGHLAGSPGDAFVDRTLELETTTQRSADYLRIDARLAPSGDNAQTPTLTDWDLQVSCVPAE